MLLAPLVALMIAWATGTCVVRWLWCEKWHAPQWFLALGVGMPLGLALHSLVYLLWLCTYGALPLLMAMDVLLLLGAVALVRRQPRAELVSLTRKWSPLAWALAGAAVVVLVTAGVLMVVLIIAKPHGIWDAIGFWNLKARFFFRARETFTDAWAPWLSASHQDYPLLLPLTVARLWHYLGSDAAWVGQLVSGLFILFGVWILAGYMRILRGLTLAAAAVLLLLSVQMFIRAAPEQYADVPLSVMVLACSGALAWAHTASNDRAPRLLIVAGLFAGAAIWTKNEGIVLALGLGVATLVMFKQDQSWRAAGRSLLWVMLGSLPFVVALVLFKTFAAAGTDLIVNLETQTLGAKITDPDRHLQIIRFWADHLRQTAPWWALGIFGAYILAAGLNPSRSTRRCVVALLVVVSLTMGAYYLVYLTTFQDLAWHLTTSFRRLVLQIWPLVIFILVLLPRSPEELVPIRADS